MTSERKTAIAVGVLFFVATAAYISGSALIRPFLDPLQAQTNLNPGQARWGVLLQYINAAAVVIIVVLLFPILEQFSERSAIAYSSSRTIEFALLIVSATGVLRTNLSQQYVGLPTADRTQFQVLWTLLADGYTVTFQMAMNTLGAGSLALCYVLYVARLVPRAISLLGVAGYVALFVSGWLATFLSDLGVLLFIPGAIFEVVFPLWLIIRGFSEPVGEPRRRRSTVEALA